MAKFRQLDRYNLTGLGNFGIGDSDHVRQQLEDLGGVHGLLLVKKNLSMAICRLFWRLRLVDAVIMTYQGLGVLALLLGVFPDVRRRGPISIHTQMELTKVLTLNCIAFGLPLVIYQNSNELAAGPRTVIHFCRWTLQSWFALGELVAKTLSTALFLVMVANVCRGVALRRHASSYQYAWKFIVDHLQRFVFEYRLPLSAHIFMQVLCAYLFFSGRKNHYVWYFALLSFEWLLIDFLTGRLL